MKRAPYFATAGAAGILVAAWMAFTGVAFDAQRGHFLGKLEAMPSEAPKLACFDLEDLVSATSPLDLARANALVQRRRCAAIPAGRGEILDTVGASYEKRRVAAGGLAYDLWMRP